jgi:diadenosine tetraphosphate (Ap4A) HIT family hydrolase
MFALHPRLEQDTITLGQLSLSLLLLMNDVTYPWFILVPQRENVCEIHDLAEPDQIQLIRESSQL